MSDMRSGNPGPAVAQFSAVHARQTYTGRCNSIVVYIDPVLEYFGQLNFNFECKNCQWFNPGKDVVANEIAMAWCPVCFSRVGGLYFFQNFEIFTSGG